MTYTLTKIKSFIGNEGRGLNATLCCDGKPVAFVIDDANGGPLQIDFRNPGQNRASYEAHKATCAAAEAACLKWAAEWFKTSPDAASARKMYEDLRAAYPDSPYQQTEEQQAWAALETWVNTTADAIETAKREAAQIKRWAKTKTVFRLIGDKEGCYRTLNKPVTTPGAIQFLVKHYGADKIEMVHGVDLTVVRAA